LIASFHLVEYRKRVLSPPRRLAGQVAGLCFWRPLNIGGDFAWFREHPSRWGLYRRLRPDFRRWAFYAAWEEEAALGEFLAASKVGRGWREGATEACHFWLRPTRVRGPWKGMQVLRGFESAGKADGPVVYLARLELSPRGTVAMWGSAAPNLFHHLPAGDQLLLGLPLVDRPYVQPVSFSVWRCDQSAVTFAHREQGHRDAVRRVRRSQHDVVRRFSSGRFEPYRCEGTWKGQHPLALAASARDDRSAEALIVNGS
jgi:hypothetical protein